MLRDPYLILGVPHDASQAEIKAAYRALAKRYHPDMYPGDHATLERFRDVRQAYEVLREAASPAAARGDGDRRASARRSRDSLYRRFAAKAARRPAENVIGDLFATKGAAALPTYQLDLSFEEAALGATKRVRLPSGCRLDVRIPGGVTHGQRIRLRAQGDIGSAKGDTGDAMLSLNVKTHPLFRRYGANVELELPVTIDEAVLGAKVRVPTVDGSVTLTIPAGSNAGTIFRVKGKGAQVKQSDDAREVMRGDQYVSLKIVLPNAADSSFARLVRKWSARHRYDARAGFAAFQS